MLTNPDPSLEYLLREKNRLETFLIDLLHDLDAQDADAVEHDLRAVRNYFDKATTDLQDNHD